MTALFDLIGFDFLYDTLINIEFNVDDVVSAGLSIIPPAQGVTSV